MATAAMPLTSYISQASSGVKQYKTLVAAFGDGYSQRVSDGINNELETWSIIWGNITSSQLSTLISTFDSVKGSGYLTWTAPGDSTEKKWRISGNISRTALSGSIYNVQIDVERVFDL